jgi:hypothetical protein
MLLRIPFFLFFFVSYGFSLAINPSLHEMTTLEKRDPVCTPVDMPPDTVSLHLSEFKSYLTKYILS